MIFTSLNPIVNSQPDLLDLTIGFKTSDHSLLLYKLSFLDFQHSLGFLLPPSHSCFPSWFISKLKTLQCSRDQTLVLFSFLSTLTSLVISLSLTALNAIYMLANDFQIYISRLNSLVTGTWIFNYLFIISNQMFIEDFKFNMSKIELALLGHDLGEPGEHWFNTIAHRWESLCAWFSAKFQHSIRAKKKKLWVWMHWRG